MAGTILLKITTDDKGNPAIVKLGQNAKKAKGQVGSLGDTMKKAFAVIGVYKGLQYGVQALRTGVTEAAKYEQALKRISAVAGVSASGIQGLSDVAKEMALNTEHSATAIANAMLEITKMGFDPRGTIKAMPEILNLATAAGEDLNWTAKNSINIMKAFGMEASEMGRIANVVATALNKTSLNLEDYMEAMKFVAPIAKSTNTSFEETSAILGVLSDMSIRGSLAGTQMKNMLLNLLKVTPEVRERLKGMNFEGKSLTDILEALKKSGITVGEVLKQFNKRAVTGALAIGDNADAVRELTRAFEEQERTAKEVADEMRTSLIAQFQRFQNILNVIIMGDREDNFISSLAASFSDLNDYLAENHTEISKTIGQIAELSVAVGKFIAHGLVLVAEHFRTIAAAYATMQVMKWGNHFMSAGVGVAGFTGKIKALNATLAFGPMALTIAMGEVLRLLDKWEAKIDKQTANVSTKFRTEEHRKELEALQKAYANFKEKSDIDYDKPGWMAKHKERISALSDLIALQDKYNNKWTKTLDLQNSAGDRKWVENVKRNLDIVLKAGRGQGNKKAYGDLLGDGKPDEDGGYKKGDSRFTLSNEELGMVSEYSKQWTQMHEDRAEKVLAYIGRERELADMRAEGEKIYAEMFAEGHEEMDAIDLDLELRRRARLEERKQAMFDMYSAGINAASSFFSIQESLSQRAHEEEMERFEKKENRVLAYYDKRIAAAQGNAFLESMLMQKKIDEEQELAREQEKIEKKRAKEQNRIAAVRATADMLAGVLNVMRNTPAGIFGKVAAGLTYAGIAGSYVAQLSALKLRDGGMVYGAGNDTSDSIPARLSKGEYVMSAKNVNKVGGPEAIQQFIDRGNSYSSSRNVTLNIGNYIGNKQFTRQIISQVNKEMQRW